MIKHYESSEARIEAIQKAFIEFHGSDIRPDQVCYSINHDGEWVAAYMFSTESTIYRLGVDRETGTFFFGDNTGNKYTSHNCVPGAVYYSKGYTWLQTLANDDDKNDSVL